MAQLVNNPPAMRETWVRSLGLGRSLGEGKGYPLQYSGLENSVHGVTKSWTRLSDFHFPGRGNYYPLQYPCLGNPHGQRSLADYSPWGCKELDMTELLSTAQFTSTIHLLQLLLRCIPQVLTQCVIIFMQFKYFPFSLCIYSFILGPFKSVLLYKLEKAMAPHSSTLA